MCLYVRTSLSKRLHTRTIDFYSDKSLWTNLATQRHPRDRCRKKDSVAKKIEAVGLGEVYSGYAFCLFVRQFQVSVNNQLSKFECKCCGELKKYKTELKSSLELRTFNLCEVRPKNRTERFQLSDFHKTKYHTETDADSQLSKVRLSHASHGPKIKLIRDSMLTST